MPQHLPELDTDRRDVLKYLTAGGMAGLAGCSGNPLGGGGDEETTTTRPSADDMKMGGELIATLGADVANKDPTQINDTTSSKTLDLVYEGLMSTDFDGTPQPVLAKSLEQKEDDELTYRAKLREGVMFHGDYGEMTAEDVKWSFERFKGTPRESDVYLWYDSSTIVDQYTIDIHLKEKYAPFKTSVGVSIVPKEAKKPGNDQSDKPLDLTTNPIGTGPYEFVEHQPDSLFRVEAYDDHWFEGSEYVPAEQPIKTITWRVITEQSAQYAALQGGDVDMINNPPASNVSELKSNDTYAVNSTMGGGYDLFIFPLEVEPFNNPKVRRGVTRLIPRESIVSSVYYGLAEPAYTPFAPLVDRYLEDGVRDEVKEKWQGHDVEKAKEILQTGFDEAGVSKPFETTIITNQNPQRVKWTQLIQEAMNQTEFFDVSIEQYEWNTYLGRLFSTDPLFTETNQLAALGWSAGFDPDNYVHYIYGSDSFAPACCNINHYKNERVDELLSKGLGTFDQEERKNYYTELTKIVGEECPISILQFSQVHDATRADRVANWWTYPIDGGEYTGVYAPYADTAAWLTK